MYLTGLADEASHDIAIQIQATRELGWHSIESRATNCGTIASMSDEQFALFAEKLSLAGIRINAYGSGIANWAKPLSHPPHSSYKELQRALPRLQTLGTTLVRIMSFHCPEDATINTPACEKEVVRRLTHLARMAEDAGLRLLHENCDNWGGRSWEHTLRILEGVNSPALRLVFDTGNPVFRKDIRFGSREPYPYQNALEFYREVREFIDYVHIKDGVIENGHMRFTWPGEGDGYVREILADLYQRGYDGGISIEPHLAVVFHDNTVQSDDQVRYSNYVAYGKKMELLVREAGWTAHG